MKITVLLLLTLTFTPIASVAQVAPEVEIPIATQARSDAQRDAENYNATYWTTAGFLVSVVSGSIRTHVCLSTFEVTPPIYYNNPVACFLCLSAIPVAFLILPHIKKVSPPTERLMGKSAEYVSVYVETYTEEVKRKRLKYATHGCVAGGILQGVVGGLLIHSACVNWTPAFF